MKFALEPTRFVIHNVRQLRVWVHVTDPQSHARRHLIQIHDHVNIVGGLPTAKKFQYRGVACIFGVFSRCTVVKVAGLYKY